jgi:NadR type nicotinamide-nucleotide adenylyltransferase
METSFNSERRLIRIAVLGPESTGKTELCTSLASHFNTTWVPEYARTYLQNRPGNYSREDVLFCVAGQRALEDAKASEANRYLFCDTEMINFKVWITDKFGSAPDWITEDIHRRYDAYLLTSPDIPFVSDPMRENPERREFFFDWYRREVKATGLPFEIITGEGAERLHNAVNAVQRLLSAASVV